MLIPKWRSYEMWDKLNYQGSIPSRQEGMFCSPIENVLSWQFGAFECPYCKKWNYLPFPPFSSRIIVWCRYTEMQFPILLIPTNVFNRSSMVALAQFRHPGIYLNVITQLFKMAFVSFSFIALHAFHSIILSCSLLQSDNTAAFVCCFKWCPSWMRGMPSNEHSVDAAMTS
jgi:hypothetical protein